MKTPIKLTVRLMEFKEKERHQVHERIQSWIGKPVLDKDRKIAIGSIEVVWIEDNSVMAGIVIDPAVYHHHFAEWVANQVRSMAFEF